MSDTTRTIVDDNSDLISYAGGGWEVWEDVQRYGGSSHFHTLSDSGQAPASINITFQGTALELYGVPGQSFSVSIDGATPSSQTIQANSSYQHWYRSPDMPHGWHTILLTDLDTMSFDYALITSKAGTSLDGKRVVVDNEDASISWTGEWRWSTASIVDIQGVNHHPRAGPLGGSTQRTFTAGDTFTFDFSGSSVALYGMFSWGMLGSLTVTYTIDSHSTTNTYAVTTSTPEFINGVDDSPNFHFFSADSLEPGAHTLKVDINACNNQTFALDYITFAPLSSETSRVGGAKNASRLGAANGPGLPLTSDASGKSQKHLDERAILAIIGGSVGGLVFLVGSLFLMFCILKGPCRKDKRRLRHPYRPGRGSELSESFAPLIEPKFSPASPDTPSEHGSHYSTSPHQYNDPYSTQQRPFSSRYPQMSPPAPPRTHKVLAKPPQNRPPRRALATIRTTNLSDHGHGRREIGDHGHRGAYMLPSASTSQLSTHSATGGPWTSDDFRPPWLTPITERSSSPTSMYAPLLPSTSGPMNATADANRRGHGNVGASNTGNLSTFSPHRHSPLTALSNLSVDYLATANINGSGMGSTPILVPFPPPNALSNTQHREIASSPLVPNRFTGQPTRPSVVIPPHARTQSEPQPTSSDNRSNTSANGATSPTSTMITPETPLRPVRKTYSDSESGGAPAAVLTHGRRSLRPVIHHAPVVMATIPVIADGPSGRSRRAAAAAATPASSQAPAPVAQPQNIPPSNIPPFSTTGLPELPAHPDVFSPASAYSTSTATDSILFTTTGGVPASDSDTVAPPPATRPPRPRGIRGPLPQPPVARTASSPEETTTQNIQPGEPLSPLRRNTFANSASHPYSNPNANPNPRQRPTALQITTPNGTTGATNVNRSTSGAGTTPAYAHILSAFWPSSRTAALLRVPVSAAASEESFGGDVPPAYHTLSRHPSNAAAAAAAAMEERSEESGATTEE